MSARRAWTLAWAGGSLLGIANGVLREVTYKDRVGERAAHQLSAASLVAPLAGYFGFLQKRWPIPMRRDAGVIGGTWLVLTVAFEFGFGRSVDRKSGGELLRDYDLHEGRVWPLVLAWIAAGPAVTRELVH